MSPHRRLPLRVADARVRFSSRTACTSSSCWRRPLGSGKGTSHKASRPCPSRKGKRSWSASCSRGGNGWQRPKVTTHRSRHFWMCCSSSIGRETSAQEWPLFIEGARVLVIAGRYDESHSYFDRRRVRCTSPTHRRCAKSRSVQLMCGDFAPRAYEFSGGVASGERQARGGAPRLRPPARQTFTRTGSPWARKNAAVGKRPMNNYKTRSNHTSQPREPDETSQPPKGNQMKPASRPGKTR